ncbi:hypothetical protein ROBYS_14590 [Roseobacter sp. OBYS 0001]|nr:hypothetical protein ROBYS_14590 [Roseobacter sp. OBYS 0001]
MVRQPCPCDPGDDGEGRDRPINAAVDHILEVPRALTYRKALGYFCRAVSVFLCHAFNLHD